MQNLTLKRKKKRHQSRRGVICEVGGIKEGDAREQSGDEQSLFHRYEKVTINSPHAPVQCVYANERSEIIPLVE